jgi:hypothetical protein
VEAFTLHEFVEVCDCVMLMMHHACSSSVEPGLVLMPCVSATSALIAGLMNRKQRQATLKKKHGGKGTLLVLLFTPGLEFRRIFKTVTVLWMQYLPVLLL